MWPNALVFEDYILADVKPASAPGAAGTPGAVGTSGMASHAMYKLSLSLTKS